jgi:hypothetical protein
MCKAIFFFLGTLPFNPWEILATWLHIGDLQNLHRKISYVNLIEEK